MVEQDENNRLVAKPYDVNEATKQKAQELEEQPAMSLVTAALGA